jgi:aquaporin Z
MNALRHHYPEYLMEAAGLGLFMIAASVVTVFLEYPLERVLALFAKSAL